VRSNQVRGEPTTVEVTNLAGRVEFLVGVGPSHEFFGGANIYLAILNLNSHELLVDSSNVMLGYLMETMVSPLMSTTKTKSIQNERMAKDIRTQAQKNAKVALSWGSS